ncbi:MAG: chromophore lyase CpcT/CpeT [Candidatus Krumholzibacteriia bacterium]
MNRFTEILATALLLAALAGCASTSAGRRSADLDVLVAWMTGSFSSGAQAETDPDNYYDIRLEMAPIWPGRTDGAWLYVEQAAASSLDRPYRQRVYRVHEVEPGLFASEVYELPDPAAAVGAWRDPARLAGLSPQDLVSREGCAVYLRRQSDGSFTGGTRDRECGSSLRGAAYATSEITLQGNRLESWDRGWDAAGVQVWGAEKGPYVFVKR